jgi:hypothetical protein
MISEAAWERVAKSLSGNLIRFTQGGSSGAHDQVETFSPKLEKRPFIELRREQGEREIRIIDTDGRVFEYDLTETEITTRLVESHGMDLGGDEEKLNLLLSALWSYGIVIFWPESSSWEIL